MLEQAIVDAAALREAALKNAEQAIIDKYAPQIKAAVDTLLESETRTLNRGDLVKYEGRYARVTTESDNGKVGITMIGEEKTNLVLESDLEEATEGDLLSEQEEVDPLGGSVPGSAPEAVFDPGFAAADLSPDEAVDLEMELEFDPEDFKLDLEQLKHIAAVDQPDPEEIEGTEDLLGDLDLPGGDDLEAEVPETDEEDLALQEIMNIISEIEEEEVLEEELVVDMAGEHKNGTFETSKETLGYQQEMELAKMESSEHKEEKEALEKRIQELDEALSLSQTQTKDFESIIEKLEDVLNETLLSNAKLLYSNNTLSDASLNERQKRKIVEAIAKANTPEEAKALQETLRATVGSTKKYKPQSLSESIQRKSTLSGILPRKNKPSQELTFADRMKKLAGID
tara:strand:+ start:1090 stop:2286 length:1197 start_codon:yes stop_codon:yes gene_type:complete